MSTPATFPPPPPESLLAEERRRARRSPRAFFLALDVAALRFLRTRGHTPAAERAVLAYTELGEHGRLWLGIAALGFAFHGGHRRAYVRAVRAIALTYMANTAIKLTVDRARPLLEGLPPLHPTLLQRSYPSAHSSMSFAGAHALGRTLPAAPLYAAAVAMALSRPYVGVHYPSDVLAGALLGAAVAEISA